MSKYWVLTLFLAYYWMGFDIATFGEPNFGYNFLTSKRAEGSALRKIAAGMFWPITAIRRKEFGMSASFFIGSLIVIALTLRLTVPHIGVFWAIMLIGAVHSYPIPVVSAYYNSAAFLVAMVIYVVPQLILRRSRAADEPLLRRGLAIARARHL